MSSPLYSQQEYMDGWMAGSGTSDSGCIVSLQNYKWITDYRQRTMCKMCVRMCLATWRQSLLLSLFRLDQLYFAPPWSAILIVAIVAISSSRFAPLSTTRCSCVAELVDWSGYPSLTQGGCDGVWNKNITPRLSEWREYQCMVVIIGGPRWLLTFEQQHTPERQLHWQNPFTAHVVFKLQRSLYPTHPPCSLNYWFATVLENICHGVVERPRE